MSDLQCPATFHVFGPQAGLGPLVGGAAAAASYAGSGRPEANESDVEILDETRPLDVVLEDLADLHRGTHVVVLADAVTPPLTGPDDVVVVRIDADGRSIERH